jgi:glycosyltransferase involved in cell wall biosynthesis
MSYTFSVLICTYNRSELLRKSLDSLIEGTIEKPDQIVIVNGGSKAADEVVKSYMGMHGIEIKIINTINKNLAASRNVGIPYCRGDIVAMTDDDAEVFPDWVTKMKQVHSQHPEAGAVGGMVLGRNIETLLGRVADAVTFPVWRAAQAVRTLPGVNISYKRAYLENIGLQDETLFRGEDVDYNWRVQKIGGLIWFDPSIKVYHRHRPTLQGFLAQHYMYGRAYLLVRRKWREMYCVYPHQLSSFRDLLKLGNFIAALVYQPFLSARKMDSWLDMVLALPFLLAANLAWKWGMVVQRFKLFESKQS